jgi:hypothetical protein
LAAVGYCEAGQIVLGRSRDGLPYGIEGFLGAVYVAIGQPERMAESTPGRRTAMRRSDRAVEAIARRAPWIVRGMARLAPASGRR